jgi:AcrR family transcriptional regulator
MSGYHHGDLKAALISEGLKILDTEGYDAFSMRKVAKACNVSQTAPYRHFKDKDELIAAIALYAMGAFNESLEQAVAAYPEDFHKQIMEMGVCYVRFFVENPVYLRLLFLGSLRQKFDACMVSNQGHMEGGHPFHTFNNAVLRYKSGACGDTRSVEELLLGFWGLVHGIAVLIVNGDIQLEGDYLETVRKTIWRHHLLS